MPANRSSKRSGGRADAQGRPPAGGEPVVSTTASARRPVTAPLAVRNRRRRRSRSCGRRFAPGTAATADRPRSSLVEAAGAVGFGQNVRPCPSGDVPRRRRPSRSTPSCSSVRCSASRPIESRRTVNAPNARRQQALDAALAAEAHAAALVIGAAGSGHGHRSRSRRSEGGHRGRRRRPCLARGQGPPDRARDRPAAGVGQ